MAHIVYVLYSLQGPFAQQKVPKTRPGGFTVALGKKVFLTRTSKFAFYIKYWIEFLPSVYSKSLSYGKFKAEVEKFIGPVSVGEKTATGVFAIAGLVGRHRVAQNGVKLREGTSPSISRRSRSARDVSASRSEESRKSGKRRSFAVMHNSMDAK